MNSSTKLRIATGSVCGVLFIALTIFVGLNSQWIHGLDNIIQSAVFATRSEAVTPFLEATTEWSGIGISHILMIAFFIFLLARKKVRKALIYFATGMFTPLILAMMAASCVVAEVIRAVARYRSFLGNAVAYAVFGLGMCGSPLPLWVFHDSFVSQIAEQGMGADYLASLDALSTTPMLIAMFAVTIVAGLAGAYIARCLFKKHFEKAGLV